MRYLKATRDIDDTKPKLKKGDVFEIECGSTYWGWNLFGTGPFRNYTNVIAYYEAEEITEAQFFKEIDRKYLKGAK
jgi:hypothetical protein